MNRTEANLYFIPLIKERVFGYDVNKVSSWAAPAWADMKANGYFDGTRPGAAMTREEVAVVMNRLRSNFLKLVAGNSDRIEAMEERLKEIETSAAEQGK